MCWSHAWSVHQWLIKCLSASCSQKPQLEGFIYWSQFGRVWSLVVSWLMAPSNGHLVMAMWRWVGFTCYSTWGRVGLDNRSPAGAPGSGPAGTCVSQAMTWTWLWPGPVCDLLTWTWLWPANLLTWTWVWPADLLTCRYTHFRILLIFKNNNNILLLILNNIILITKFGIIIKHK